MDQNSNSINLVFICSGLEPGRDGVGDYTRRLAAALINHGVVITIIALNDRFVATTVTTHQIADGVSVPVHRLPSALTDNTRYALVRNLISVQNTDWISLQFVPFGFHQKGLKIGLGKRLLSLTGSAKWHIMVHELWVGMDVESPIVHFLWGWGQKQLIRSLLNKIHPAVITTQSFLYQFYLAKLGYKANYLPLISNIAVIKTRLNTAKSEKIINLVLFGNIHHGASIKDFVGEVANYGVANQLNFALKIVGQCGPELDNWIREWQSFGLSLIDIGHQPEQRISEELISSAIGITTTPLAITDKSGSVAAMLAHGLPVINVSRSWHPRGVQNLPAPDGIFHYQKGNFKQFYSTINRFKTPVTDVQTVSKQLLNLLTAFNGKL